MAETFTWSIPSISSKQTRILCYGYTRSYLIQYVPHVIESIGKFFCADFVTPEDIWTAHCMQPPSRFVSPIFTLCRLPWYFELWPCGFGRDRGSMVLYLCLLSLPTNSVRLFASYKLNFKEINATMSVTDAPFRPDRMYNACISQTVLLTDMHQAQRFTFELTMSAVVTSAAVEGSQGTFVPRSLAFPSATYTWRVSDVETVRSMKSAPNCYGFASPIFRLHGLKWFVQIFQVTPLQINHHAMQVHWDLSQRQSHRERRHRQYIRRVGQHTHARLHGARQTANLFRRLCARNHH